VNKKIVHIRSILRQQTPAKAANKFYKCCISYCSVFTQKQFLYSRTAKSQPIWIKFCTHLLLYGIHLWANLDRDRRVDGSRPNQNDCFCNTCNAPSYIETTDRRDFGGKPSEWRRGRVLSWKIPEFCNVGRARSKNSIFPVFRVYPSKSWAVSTAYRKVLPPNQWYRWKAETLKVCLLL